MIKETQSDSILDYGGGKGRLYRPHNLPPKAPAEARKLGLARWWGVSKIQNFDPALPGKAKKEPADGVICTDVLEHCHEDDLDWIVEELFALARKFVFASICCSPANKHLPDGRNCHITVKNPEWWGLLFERHAKPGVQYELVFTGDHS